MRYNLQLNDNYQIIDSFYTGGKENGCLCDNCNKLISNVAVIKNSTGNIFNVGLDCAETLTNLNGLFDVQYEFAEMKALLAKVNKYKKTHELSFEIAVDGEFCCIINNQYLFSKDIEFSKKYLPHLLRNVTNPEKIGYKKFKVNIDLGFEAFLPRTNTTFSKTITVNDFECIISVQPYFRKETNELLGYDFHVKISSLNHAERITMYTRIASHINWVINEHYFNLYSNQNEPEK